MFKAVEGRWGSREIEITDVTLLDRAGAAVVRLSFRRSDVDPPEGACACAGRPTSCSASACSTPTASAATARTRSSRRWIRERLERRGRSHLRHREPRPRRRHLQARRRGPHARRLSLRLPPAALHLPGEVATPDAGIYRPRHHWTFSPGVRFKPPSTSDRLATLEVRRSRRHVRDHLDLAQSPRVLKTARRAQRHGRRRPAAVSGLTPSAKALYVAAAAHAMPRGVVLYVVPSDGDLEQAVADVCFFLAALEGCPPAAADRAVLPFPSHEVDPYRGLAPHVGVTSARARALHALATGTARVVVASAAALLPRVSAPERLLGASIDLKPGQDIAPTDLAELLVDAGFTREDPADEHGEFAIRGGISTSFRPARRQPVRLEFIGDTIESLRTYDPATQRSIETDRSDRSARSPLRRRARATDSRARRSSTTCRARREHRDRRVRARRSRRARAQAGRAGPAQLRGSARARRERLAAPADAARASGPTSTARLDARQRTSRSSGSTTMRRRRPRPFASRRSSCTGRVGRLGRRDPPAARRGRHDAVRRRHAGPRRAHDRAAQGIRRLRGAGRARRRRAVRRGARGHRQPVARLPAARRRPADLRRNRRLRGGAPRAGAPAIGRPRRSSRTFAISRSAIWSSTSITASARSSG